MNFLGKIRARAALAKANAAIEELKACGERQEKRLREIEAEGKELSQLLDHPSVITPDGIEAVELRFRDLQAERQRIVDGMEEDVAAAARAFPILKEINGSEVN